MIDRVPPHRHNTMSKMTRLWKQVLIFQNLIEKPFFQSHGYSYLRPPPI